MFMHYFFFFSSRRRHTRCSRDWSSDVCSSDLRSSPARGCTAYEPARAGGDRGGDRAAGARLPGRGIRHARLAAAAAPARRKIGRGACWGRVEISGGAGLLKKKKKDNVYSIQ